MDEIDAVVATGFYHDPRLRSVITALKYKNATCLLPSLERYLKQWSAERRTSWPWAGEESLAIQHVPTSPTRVRERGFDQARLIAGACRATFAPWATPSTVLRRVSSGSQALLEPGALRGANVRGAFSVDGIVPRSILLVDDVLTTGSTMNEAARVLREAGAKKIYVFAIAVGR
jgi:ComF family protein